MSTASPIVPDLAQRLADLHAALIDLSNTADRLDDAQLSWDVGLALLAARDNVAAALRHVTQAPRSTIVHSAALDRAYADVDLLFVA